MLSHPKLLDKISEIKKLPSVTKEGLCYGITLAIAQEIFRGSLISCVRKLRLLTNISDGELQSEINKAREKQQQLHHHTRADIQTKWRKAKPFNPDIAFEKQLNSEESKDYYVELSLAFLKIDDNLTIREQDLLMMEAFFQTMIIYHDSRIIKHLFTYKEFPHNQNAISIFPKILPKSLMDTKNGIEKPIIKKVISWHGLYQKNLPEDDLKECVRILNKYLNRYRIQNPVIFLFSGGNHTESVIFEPAIKHWRLVDSNQLNDLEKPTDKPAVIAKFIWRSYANLGALPFDTLVLSSNSDKKIVLQCIKKCRSEKSWKRIHTINKTKAKLADSFGTSWLHIAARMGDVDRVKLLLENSALIDEKFSEKFTALYVAAQFGHAKVIQELLRNKVNVNVLTNQKESPLHIAALHGFPHTVRILLKAKIFVDIETKGKKTPLIAAVETGHFQTTKILIKAKANVNIHSEIGEMPLTFATINKNLPIIKLLLKAKADPEVKINNFRAPFLIAAQYGNIEMLDLFFQHGISNIDYQGPKNETAIFLAAQNGHTKTVEWLLTKKANPNISLSCGKTPLLAAINNHHLAATKLLIDKKADVEKAYVNGCTPLLKAVGTNQIETVKLLLQANVNVNHEYKVPGCTGTYVIFDFTTKETLPEIKKILKSYRIFSELKASDFNANAFGKLKRLREDYVNFKKSLNNYRALRKCTAEIKEFIDLPRRNCGKKQSELIENLKVITQSTYQSFGDADTTEKEEKIIEDYKISVNNIIQVLPDVPFIADGFYEKSPMALLMRWQIKYQVIPTEPLLMPLPIRVG